MYHLNSGYMMLHMKAANDIISIIIAVVSLWMLGWLYDEILHSTQPQRAKQIIVLVAFFNGILIGAGLAPYIQFGQQLVQLSKFVPPAYLILVHTLVGLGTIFEILIGLKGIWETSRFPGLFAFALAFISGTLLPTSEYIDLGILLFIAVWPVVLLSPSEQMFGTRR